MLRAVFTITGIVAPLLLALFYIGDPQHWLGAIPVLAASVILAPVPFALQLRGQLLSLLDSDDLDVLSEAERRRARPKINYFSKALSLVVILSVISAGLSAAAIAFASSLPGGIAYGALALVALSVASIVVFFIFMLKTQTEMTDFSNRIKTEARRKSRSQSLRERLSES